MHFVNFFYDKFFILGILIEKKNGFDQKICVDIKYSFTKKIFTTYL